MTLPAALALPDATLVSRFDRDLARLPVPLSGEDEIAVGVSGGPDSLALLLLAAAARPGRIVAVTVDHGLRPASADEACFVAGVCGALNVPHHTLRIVVPDDPAGLQAAARAARYAAIAEWCRERGASAVAAGHHLDDQAETVLMRIERGAGVAGLAGIRAVRTLGGNVTLIRPLLGWRRIELAAIVRTAGLRAVDDPSNHDRRFDRADVRARLAGGWPDPVRLAAIAHHAAEAEIALSFASDRLFAERYDDPAQTLTVCDLPRELRRRLLLKAFARLAPDAIVRGPEVDRLLDRLAENRVSTLAGLRIEPGNPWRLGLAPPHRSN